MVLWFEYWVDLIRADEYKVKIIMFLDIWCKKISEQTRKKTNSICTSAQNSPETISYSCVLAFLHSNRYKLIKM